MAVWGQATCLEGVQEEDSSSADGHPVTTIHQYTHGNQGINTPVQSHTLSFWSSLHIKHGRMHCRKSSKDWAHAQIRHRWTLSATPAHQGDAI